jgi:glycosyltransferase involved in cell wall biosynthesis
MGIDETFLITGENRKWERSDKPFTILSNRNLLPIYNVSLLIRAIPVVLHQVKKIRILIAGDGSERKKLEEEVKKLNAGTAVQFLGQIPHEEMASLLAQADIYVSTRNDGASVSLFEAIGAGTFPIVTDIPANWEWITMGKMAI